MALSPTIHGGLSALMQRYLEVRRMTETLCAPLSAEDQMVQSMAEASPTKWHQAHATWFFETFVLEPHLADYQPYDPTFRFLFNSYYKQVADTAGGAPHPDRGLRGSFSRPSLQHVLEYRRHVDASVLRLIEDATEDVAALIELGTHHEQQHQELILTDIKHAFWTHPLRPAYHEPAPATPRQTPGAGSTQELPLEWVPFRGGVVEIGHDGADFAFDNEKPAHDVLLEPYCLASRVVTNGEYLDFVQDGGYAHPELWLSDGWDRVCAERWRSPLYWEKQDDQWHEFTLTGLRPVDEASPVCHVSYYEADAFARWAGARLPREEEWENAGKQSSVAAHPPSANLLESGIYHPAPARRDPRPAAQLFGDVWEWTASAYLGYPGYRPDPGALGEYNGKFMSGQMVLRGGSCATPASHIRATYRNFFPPHARWQFMGIRLAKDGD